MSMSHGSGLGVAACPTFSFLPGGPLCPPVIDSLRLFCETGEARASPQNALQCSRMSEKTRALQTILIATAIALVAVLVLSASFALLPAPPRAATPTFPLGIQLPDTLPRISE